MLATRISLVNARRFITLTMAPDPDLTLAEHIDLINAGWRNLWKRLRREYGPAARGYVKVVELTAIGTPHLHILVDAPFIPQRHLSAAWYEITGQRIVDIRLIKSKQELSRYVSKYLTKNHAYDTPRRRWSQSKGFLPPLPPIELEEGEQPPTWRFRGASSETVAAYYLANGYVESNGWLLPASLAASGLVTGGSPSPPRPPNRQ